MSVADVMTPTTVAVPAEATVTTAVDLMLREDLPVLPVVSDGRVVGLVTPTQLLRWPNQRRVNDIMTTPLLCATPELSLVQAHGVATHQRLEVLPVTLDGRLVGQITLLAILQAQGQQTDPLTGLPWATALRTWAASALRRGHEMAMVFVDVDNFGVVNKALGHVEGDKILRALASLVGASLDPGSDLLCRYGGDEFAIATTRAHDAARALAARIQQDSVVPAVIRGATRYVTVSVGFAGGRRVHPRGDAHVAATVDDLLSIASHASTAAKESSERARRTAWADAGRWGPPGGPSDEARLRLVEVIVSKDPQWATASVQLRLGPLEGTGTAGAPGAHAQPALLVAQATVAAILQTVGDRFVFAVDELTEVPTRSGVLAVVVVNNGSDTTPGFVGAARAADPSDAVAKAVLDALNRPLAKPLAEILRRAAHS